LINAVGFRHTLVIHSFLGYWLDNVVGGAEVGSLSSSDKDPVQSLWTKTFGDVIGEGIFAEMERGTKLGGRTGVSSWSGGDQISFWDGELFDMQFSARPLLPLVG